MARKARTNAMVAVGFSSMIQWPESGTTPSSTSVAAKRITAAMVRPKDFSPPSASTGMSSLPAARKALLSIGVLVEGGELREAGVHGAGAGVERGVVPARRLAEALGMAENSFQKRSR